MERLMKLIIPQSLAAEVTPRIHEIAPTVTVVPVDSDGRADSVVDDADMLLRAMPHKVFTRLLNAAPHLRWVHTLSAGIDTIPIAELGQRAITLTNSAGAHAIPISEFVMALVLAQVKQVRQIAALSPDTSWETGRAIKLGELYGSTMLIIGFGSIGREVARRATPFGVRVLASRRRPAPVDGVALVVGEMGWRALLPEADYVVISTPLTNTTRGMIDQAAFAAMKRGAYLINIARGAILDTNALLATLQSGQLAGAALDVLPEEPLPANHPLWTAQNVAISPHISGSSPRTNARELEYFFDNLRRYVVGEPLVNIVDLEAGY